MTKTINEKLYNREYASKPGILDVFRSQQSDDNFDFRTASREVVADKFSVLMKAYGLDTSSSEENWGIDDINTIPRRLWEATLQAYADAAYNLGVHDPKYNLNATEEEFKETLKYVSRDFIKITVPMTIVFAWDVANSYASFPRAMFDTDKEAIEYARGEMVELDGDCGISVNKVPVYLYRQTERFAVRNYTPHDVNVYDDEGNVVVTYPSMGIARVTEHKYHAENIVVRDWDDDTNIPISYKSFGEVTGLPNDKFDNGRSVLYIVSGYVKSALPDRHDLITPDNPVRDADGNIIGCRGFSMQW